MATTVELATGYVSLAVDASKVGAQVGKAFNGAERQGNQAGQKIGQAMAKSFDRTKPDMGKLGADVERAEQRATTAIERNATKQENAKRKVDIAQAKLNETIDKYGKESSQALGAQDRLSLAQQKHEATALGARQEQDKLNRELRDAKDAFSQAEKAASSAASGSDAASEKYARGWRGVGQKIRRFVVGGVDDATDAADREAGQSQGAEKYASGWRGVGQKIRGDLKRGVKSATDTAEDQAERGGREAGGGFKTAFKGAVAGMAAYIGIQEIGQTMWSSVQGAGELEQSVGAINTIFGDSSGQMLKWSGDAATAVGLGKNEFNELGTLIGSQLKNGGVAMDELGPKTNDLIGLGADLSSMFGGDTRTAVEALSSALKGERDPIEAYGVSLNQAAIDAKAAELGFQKTGGALSAEANQAATLALIMDQTADAHGNFASESDTFAHKQQVMAAQWENLKAKMGELFLPVLTKVFGFIGEKAIPAMETFAGGIRAFGAAWSANTDDITSSGFAGFMEGLANGLRNTYDWLSRYAGIWGPFAIGIGIVAAAYGIWAAASWALTAAQGALATAIAAVNWPIVAIIAAIGLLIGAFILAYNRIGWFKTAVNAAWAGIKFAIGAVVTWFTTVAWPLLSAVLSWIGQRFVWLWQNVAVPAWNFIRAAAAGFVTWLTTVAWPVLQAAIQAIGGFFTWLWQTAVVPAWNFIRAAVSGFVTWFTTVAWPALQSVVRFIGQVFMWLWNNIVRPAWYGIRVIVAAAVAVVMTIFQGLVWFVRNVLGPVFTWLLNNIVRPVWTWITGAIRNAWQNGIRPTFDALKQGISWVGDRFQAVRVRINNIWQQVQLLLWRGAAYIKLNVYNPIKQGISWVGDRFSAVRNRIGEIWDNLRARLFNGFVAIRDRTLNPLKQAASWLADRFSAVRNRIGQIWDNLRARLFDGWVAIRSRTIDPLKQAVSWLGDRFSSVRNRIGGVWSDLRTKLFDGYVAIRDKTLDPLREAARRVQRTFENVQEGIRKAWEKLKDAVKKPIKFVIQDVVNKGLIENFNKVAKEFGVKEIPTLNLPAGFRKGGWTGNGGKDDVAGFVHGRENVINAESSAAIEKRAPGFLGRLNREGAKALPNGMPRDPDKHLPRDIHAAGGKGRNGLHFGGQRPFWGFTQDAIRRTGELLINHKAPSFPVRGAMADLTKASNIDVKGVGGKSDVNLYQTPRLHNKPSWVAGYYDLANAEIALKTGAVARGASRRTLVRHEIGHALGLQHAMKNGARSMMNYDNMFKHNSITQADVNALAAIWGGKGETVAGAGGDGGGVGGLVSGLLERIGFDKITEKIPGGPFVVDIMKGVSGKLWEGFKSFVADKLNPFDDGGGDPDNEKVDISKAVEKWRPNVIDALKREGLPSNKTWQDAWLRQVRTESGGNPNAIQQVVDQNWPHNKARGLVQVIPPTFKAHRNPSLPNNQFNPDSSLSAGMRWAKSKYGIDKMLNHVGIGKGYSIGDRGGPSLRTMNSPGWMTRANAGRYDEGGLLHEGFTLMEHRRKQPDKVLTDEQWRVMSSIAEDTARSGGQTNNVYVQAREGEDPTLVGRRVSESLAFQLGKVVV